MTGARDDTDATGLGAGMALRPHHVGLSVADLDASVAW